MLGPLSDPGKWRKSFSPLPFTFHQLHLYESAPGLQYTPIWSRALIPPFEELEHTADLAFTLHGESVQAIYHNAFTALAFHFPPLLHYRQEAPDTFDKIVSQLNRALALADAENGCPFKAVSHHGELVKDTQAVLTWEMIVDV